MAKQIYTLNHLFLDWLTKNASRFPFQPEVRASDKKGVIEFTFTGMPSEISFKFISYRGITVAALHRGECLDILSE